jgi:hypothetical protein
MWICVGLGVSIVSLEFEGDRPEPDVQRGFLPSTSALYPRPRSRFLWNPPRRDEHVVDQRAVEAVARAILPLVARPLDRDLLLGFVDRDLEPAGNRSGELPLGPLHGHGAFFDRDGDPGGDRDGLHTDA